MSALPAFAANLWLVGFPLVAIAAAGLALLRRAPARARYLVALAAFVAVAALPLVWTEQGAPVVPAGAGAGHGADREWTAVAAPAAIDPALALAALWGAGAAILLLRELLAHGRLARQRRRWPAAAPSLREALRVPPRRAVLLGDVASPRTQGLLAPAIVLPAALPARAEPDVLRLIVAHEESHASWRDPLVHATLRALRCLLWVAPPVWIAERLVAREREAAADAAALARACPDARERYAQALVRFARLATRRADLLAVRLGAASDLDYRVRRILRLRTPAAGAAAAAGLLACGSLALAATPRAERPGAVVAMGVERVTAPAVAPPRSAVASGGAASQPGTPASPAEAPAPRLAALPATDGTALDPAAGSSSTGSSSTPSARSAYRGEARAVLVAEGPVEPRDVDLHRHVDIAVDRHLAVAEVAGEALATPLLAEVAAGGAAGDAPSAPMADLPPPLAATGNDDEVRVDVRRMRLVNRIVIGDEAEGRAEAPERSGRSRHPVALFHRAVTSPLKRLVRAARASADAPP